MEVLQDISIHALREEGDASAIHSMTSGFNFYPRPPRGGRRKSIKLRGRGRQISIHALREEGDCSPCAHRNTAHNFYPRPPRGGRPPAGARAPELSQFLSTPSARRATGRHPAHPPRTSISIHALREEGDLRMPYFFEDGKISIHALREEGDGLLLVGGDRVFSISIHALREEGDVGLPESSQRTIIFLSTPSARRATAKTETKSLFSYKLYNILHEFRRALIYNGSKNYPNHAKRLENPVRRCRKDAENSPFAPGRKTQNNSRPSCSKGG